MNNEQIIADLQATKDQMTPENWNPSGCMDGDKRCVLMHLRQVTVDADRSQTTPEARARYTEAGDALSLHIPFVTEPNYMLVGNYNDRSYTTFADIQALIDKTLADLGGLG